MYTACTGCLHGSYTPVYESSTAVGRYAAAYGPCTRSCNVSCARYTAAVYTAREHVFARENGPYTAVYGPCPSTPLVYMTMYGPSVRTSSAVYMARTRPRIHGTCTRPCTGCAHDTYTAAYVSTCLRVQGPYTRPCTGHLHGRKRPSTRPYTAVHGRVRPYTAV